MGATASGQRAFAQTRLLDPPQRWEEEPRWKAREQTAEGNGRRGRRSPALSGPRRRLRIQLVRSCAQDTNTSPRQLRQCAPFLEEP